MTKLRLYRVHGENLCKYGITVLANSVYQVRDAYPNCEIKYDRPAMRIDIRAKLFTRDLTGTTDNY
jgi:hypothetical protein